MKDLWGLLCSDLHANTDKPVTVTILYYRISTPVNVYPDTERLRFANHTDVCRFIPNLAMVYYTYRQAYCLVFTVLQSKNIKSQSK